MSKPHALGILDRITTSSEPSVVESEQFDPKGPYKAVGYCRKAWGGEPMIDFIWRDGNSDAIAYSDIRRIRYNPSIGIVIKTMDCEITIRGERLRDVKGKLLQFRVTFMAEADLATQKLHDAAEPIIKSIEIAPVKFPM
jgi:hypothetical protein